MPSIVLWQRADRNSLLHLQGVFPGGQGATIGVDFMIKTLVIGGKLSAASLDRVWIVAPRFVLRPLYSPARCSSLIAKPLTILHFVLLSLLAIHGVQTFILQLFSLGAARTALSLCTVTMRHINADQTRRNPRSRVQRASFAILLSHNIFFLFSKRFSLHRAERSEKFCFTNVSA